MNEAMYGLIGAFIGGLMTLLGTVLTLRHTRKLELRKLTFFELKERKLILEDLQKELIHDWTQEKIEENEQNIYAEYISIAIFLAQKAHIFIDSDKIKFFESKIGEIESNNGEFPEIVVFSWQIDLINNFKDFLKVELRKTIKHINELVGIK